MDNNEPTNAELKAQLDDMSAKLYEIHAFTESLANMMQSPMLAAMLPPNMRG